MLKNKRNEGKLRCIVTRLQQGMPRETSSPKYLWSSCHIKQSNNEKQHKIRTRIVHMNCYILSFAYHIVKASTTIFALYRFPVIIMSTLSYQTSKLYMNFQWLMIKIQLKKRPYNNLINYSTKVEKYETILKALKLSGRTQLLNELQWRSNQSGVLEIKLWLK
jgi:hypothetical protein